MKLILIVLGLLLIGVNAFAFDSDGDGIEDSADYCPTWPVKIVGGQYYTSLQTAYDSAADNDIVLSQFQPLVGDFTLNRSISASLEAGYDCDFLVPIGETELTGEMRVSNGTLRITGGTGIFQRV